MNISGGTILFPMRSDVRGTLATTADRDVQIKQAIRDILETRRGERKMLPDYGIPDFVFDVMDFGFTARLTYQLEEQIKRYVPLVESIEIQSATDENNRAAIEIFYTEVGSINAPGNLVFPVWRFVKE